MSLDVGHLHGVPDRSFSIFLVSFRDAMRAAWITDTIQSLAQGVAGDEHGVGGIHQNAFDH
jgi:hypothetical protein